MISLLAQTTQSFWMPPEASTVADDVDGLFYFISAITLISFFAVAIAMVIFAIKYRHRPGREHADRLPAHSTALELTWTMVPTAIVIMVFYFAFRVYLHMSVLPPNAYEIQVTSQMWNWSFTYPNGYTGNELHVPVNVPVRLVLSSNDVIHSLYVPQFRVKKDAVPQRFNRMWFQATQLGEFDIYCAEYCGQQHSLMRSKVVVHEKENFDKWLEEASNWEKRMTPLEAGRMLAHSNGCIQCHSEDGSVKTGPTFKDLFGKQEPLTNGTSVLVDENYITESLYDPAAKVVRGYTVQMSSYEGRLNQRDVGAIITYLKSISVTGGTTTPTTAPAPTQ